MQPDPKQTVKQTKMFELVLDDLNNGNTSTDLAGALAEVVQAVQHTGKVGKLTFQIKVKPGNRGEVSKVEIEDEIKVSLPTCDRAKSFFFVGREGELSRKDPNQPELPLKHIKTANIEPLRTVKEA